MIIRNNRRGGPPTRTMVCLRWGRNLCFGVGILSLGYCGYILLDAHLYEAYQSWRFQESLNGLAPADGTAEDLQPVALPAVEAESNRTRTMSLGGVGREGIALGRIEIGAVGLEAMIMEGTEDRTLRRAVGHIPGTPLPGQPGNAAIAGHRDTFFRPLRKIRENDEITLTTLAGSYRYRVNSIKVVEPDDITVLDQSDTAILTLVTCFPFYYVGPAPKRFIVRAHLVSTEALKPRMDAAGH